ncbi:MAG TPA: hypothetical protein VF331_27685 [Polyangiales bacterium]
MEDTEVLTADDETGERFLKAYNLALPDMLALIRLRAEHGTVETAAPRGVTAPPR